MIPPDPEASYLADGLVISSIRFTSDADVNSSKSAPFIEEGFPLMNTSRLGLP